MTLHCLEVGSSWMKSTRSFQLLLAFETLEDIHVTVGTQKKSIFRGIVAFIA